MNITDMIVQQRKTAMQQDKDCYTKAARNDEQTFTVVEHDPTASLTILKWIELNWQLSTPPEKLYDAFMDALAMRHSNIPKRVAD